MKLERLSGLNLAAIAGKSDGMRSKSILQRVRICCIPGKSILINSYESATRVTLEKTGCFHWQEKIIRASGGQIAFNGVSGSSLSLVVIRYQPSYGVSPEITTAACQH
ncbi:hypothetical protein Bbelb_171900 [Branchiostoma belcheri]|nr:hypothetical protein Bbelb_171900 [Branchiostoma belcheri]